MASRSKTKKDLLRKRKKLQKVKRRIEGDLSRTKQDVQALKEQLSGEHYLQLNFGHQEWAPPAEDDPVWVAKKAEALVAFAHLSETDRVSFLEALREACTAAKNDGDIPTRAWLENATHDQLMVGFCEGMESAGTSPAAGIALAQKAMMRGYDDMSHYVAVIPVHLAHLADPIPLFPVFEIICKHGIPEIPDNLKFDVLTASVGDFAEIVITDPTAPEADRPFYVGNMRFSEQLKLFEQLRRTWGHFFLRLSHDSKKADLLNSGATPFMNEEFYPASGVYYKDYMVFDAGHSRTSNRGSMNVADVSSRIHLMAKSVVRLAATCGPRKFVQTIADSTTADDYPSFASTRISVQRTLLDPMLSITGTKLPWKLKQAPNFRNINKKLMLHNFFRIIELLKKQACDESSSEEARQQAADLWAGMRNARPYEFTPAAFHRLDEACESYVMEEVLGMEFSSMEEFHRNFGFEDAVAIVELMEGECGHVPYPEKLPFEHCYFGWGPGVRVDRGKGLSSIGHVAAQGIHPDAWDDLTLLGHLVSANGRVVSFYDCAMRNKAQVELTASFERNPKIGTWKEGCGLVPWMIVTMVGEVMAHAVVEEHKLPSSARRKFARMGNKRQGIPKPVPPDYYTVYIRDRMILQRVRKAMTGTGRKQSYRHDVEGYERLHYQVGKLPIAADDRAALVNRGYTIYPHGTPIPADMQVLMMHRRREFPRPGEWVALMKVFVDNFISPKNPNLPYVPAVRKTTKGVTSFNYKEEDDE